MREDEIKELIRDLRIKQEEDIKKEEPTQEEPTQEEPTQEEPTQEEPTQDESGAGDKTTELEDLVDRLEKVLDRLDRILGDDQDEDEDQPEEVVEYRRMPKRVSAKEAYSRTSHYRRNNR